MAFECQGGSENPENLQDFVGLPLKDQHFEFKEQLHDQLGSNWSNPESVIETIEVSKLELEVHSKKANTSLYSLTKQLPSKDVLSNSSRSITDLPSAIVSEILNCLDPKELGIVSCVSTVLHRLASEHHAWKDFYNERWGLPFPISPASLGSGFSDEKSWKEMFVEREFRSKTYMGRFSTDLLYGHTEAVRIVFLLASAKLVFTAGYDSTVRMWDMEEGMAIASSRPLGCTIRAIAADGKLLLAGGTDGFIHCWRAVDDFPQLFDLKGSRQQNCEFRLWEHDGPITSLALDLTKIYSGSWDMTVRVWDRSSLKCVKALRHSDWVWALSPHDTTVASTSGSNVYVWDTSTGSLLTVINNAHEGNVYSLARSHTGDFLFTGGEDGVIHMFKLGQSVESDYLHMATWIPHLSPVNSLAFEFPWLVSASSDGKLALISVRKLLRSTRRSLAKKLSRVGKTDRSKVEPPQRMLHGFGSDIFSVDIGADRIVAGGEEGVVKVWNFSQALEAEQRARVLRGIRLENRMRRRKLQVEMTSKGARADQCSVAAKNSINGDRSGIWHSKRGISNKVKA